MSNTYTDNLKDRAWEIAESQLGDVTRDEIYDLALEVYNDLIEQEPDEEPEQEAVELIPGNPMIDREPQDELDRVTNRESYSFFQNNCQYENY